MLTHQTEELLIQLETDIIAAQKSSEFNLVENALADEFYEIDSKGNISCKTEVMNAIQAAPLRDYSVENFKLLPASDECVIVTYVATSRRIDKGSERTNRAHRSS